MIKVGDTVKSKASGSVMTVLAVFVENSNRVYKIRTEDGWHYINQVELVPPKSPIQLKKIIVSGRYGRVLVELGDRNEAYVALCDTFGKKHNQINFMTATELRAASAVFIELAEFLEQES